MALLSVTLCMGAETYERVDAHALKAPPASEKSLDELVRYLCPARYSDREKARSLFRWIADRVSYDLEGLRSNKMGSQSPQDVLRQRRAVCSGYSNLFKALADKAGLQCVTLSGESKFTDQLPIKLPPGVSGHAWNSVFLGGRWQLLDVTWAAGKVDPKLHYLKQFDEYWFCTPAEEFVYTHFPKKEPWQLLEKPWSRSHFQEVPLVRGDFFRLGLKLGADDHQPVQVRGDAVLRWPAPPDVVGMSDLRDSQGKVLANWTFSQSPKGYLETRLRCPGAGKFTLHVYARKRDKAWQANLKQPDSYHGVSVVTVRAERGSAGPFPKTFGSFQRSGAELLEPFQGRLPARLRQRFRIKVPGAQEVLVFAGHNPVGRLEPKGGVFQSTLSLPAKGLPLQVCAKFAQENRYWGLVEYELR